MLYFKDPENRVHAQEVEGFEHLLPDGCVPITEEEAAALTAPPAPTREQQIAANIAAIEAEMNRQAALRKYDSIKSAALRAGYPGPFHDEGVAYATWMDDCYAKGYAVLAEVDAGIRPMPTPEEAVAMMPALVLPS